MLLRDGGGLGGVSAEFSERSSGERNAVRVVDQTIQDRVAESGIPHAFVPVLDGDLTGEEGRASPGAILNHLQQIPAFPIADRRESPVVQDQEVGFAELREQFAVCAIAAGDDQVWQESRQAQIADGVPVSTRTLSKRTGEPAFSCPRRTGNEQYPVLLNPLAGREAQELRFVEAPFRAKIHIFNRRRVPQSRELQEARESPILARALFALEEQREAIFEIERDDIGRPPLLVEGVGHGGEFQAMQQVGGLLGEHYASPAMSESCGESCGESWTESACVLA